MEVPSFTKESSRHAPSAFDMSWLPLEADREIIANLKQRADLVEMLSEEISLTIDNFRKQSFLSYLLAATCPVSESRTEEMRTKELKSIISSSRVEYQEVLRQSLTKLTRVRHECSIIAQERDEILSQITVQKSMEVDMHRLDEYLQIFESISKSAKENYDRVTSEYLILRHNGTVLEDLLSERLAEVKSSYEENKQNLEQYESDISTKIDNTKLMYDFKLETITNQLRDEVMRLEADTRDLEITVHNESIRRKKARKALKQELNFYQYNYDQLQQKRKFELENVRAELSQLKDLILEVQEQMYSKYRSAGPEPVDLTSVSFTVPTSKSKIYGLKKVASADEADLQYQIESIRKVLAKASKIR